MQKALNQIHWATRKLCTEAVGGSGQHLLETEDSAYSLWTEEHGDITHPASSTDVPTAPFDLFSRSLKPGRSTIPHRLCQLLTME